MCVDEATCEIIGAVASTNDLSDAEALPALLREVPGEIDQVSADGAYDQRKCYDTLNHYRARAAMRAPQRGQDAGAMPTVKRRLTCVTRRLRRIREVGRRAWKRESGYHRRSLAETTTTRFKTIFGSRVQTRRVENQFKELLHKCALLNQMTHLGMPESVKVTG